LAYVSDIGPISRPRAGAKGVQLQVGPAVWELLEPTGDGALADYLGRYGQRIRSTVFKAGSLAEVDKHLTGQGFDLIPGDADGALAINPAQNKNLLFDFTEEPARDMKLDLTPEQAFFHGTTRQFLDDKV